MRRAILVAPVLVLVLALALAGPLANSLAAQEATPAAEDPAAALAAFDQALRADDPDALAGLFAPDGVLVTAVGTFRGHEAIHGYFAEWITTNPELEVTFGEPAVAYNTAVSRDRVVADAFLAGGAERVVFIHTLVLVAGRIAVLSALPDLTDPATVAYFTPRLPAAATPVPAPPAA
jgi:uncharacterized protein (TIGR02246 family)